MTMNQNPSFSNPFSLDFGDETIYNGQTLSHHSYLILKHVNVNDLTSSQLPLINLVDFFDFYSQNGQTFQSTSPNAIGSGQLRFSQIVTEMRRTHVTSNKVKVHKSIDYEFTAQNQLAHYPNDLIRYSQVTRSTQLLSSTLTMDHLLPSNNIVPDLSNLIPNNNIGAHVQGIISHGIRSPSIQLQSNFGNQFLIISNQANRRLVENEPFHNFIHHQNQQISRKTPPIMDLDGHTNHHMDMRVVHDHTSVSTVYAYQVKGRNPDLDPNPNHKSSLSLNPFGVPSRNRVGVSIASKNKITPHTNNNSFDDGREYDGRTHSLPYKKPGLYRCPKCLGVFHSSQKFASHMQYSHYRNESIAQRNKRLTAKNKRKNKLQLFVNEDPTRVPSQGMKNQVNVKKEDEVVANDRE
ncbi:hypothetical protein ACOSQ4_017234 [Xanthoceras sorbifolium]